MSNSNEERERDRQRAIVETGECALCGATGLVTVYRPEYRGWACDVIEEVNAMGEVTRRMTTLRTMAHCVCPLGGWLRSQSDDYARAHTPDARRIADGKSRWGFSSEWLEAELDSPEVQAFVERHYRHRDRIRAALVERVTTVVEKQRRGHASTGHQA